MNLRENSDAERRLRAKRDFIEREYERAARLSAELRAQLAEVEAELEHAERDRRDARVLGEAFDFRGVGQRRVG